MSSSVVTQNLPDVTTEQANKLLILQRDIMQKVALGHEQEYQTVLDQLCKATELLIPDAVASIMLFDETQSFLTVVSAPSLPSDAIQALNGLIPGERAGSCGTAVYSNKPQFVFNTRSDLRWADFHQFIVDFSVGACWSFPVKINNLGAIGSFALSSFEERKPSSFHVQLLETSASIASIVIKRQQEQKHLWRMAHFDALTGLPNRTLLTLRLQHSLEKIQRNHQKIAFLFLDLDNFKEINDTQGHDVGDDVLKRVATQIDDCLRPEDTVARFGGDEFIIIIDSFNGIEDIPVICNKILAATKKCDEVLNFAISTSIGVCLAPDHGDTFEALLRNADTAMYEAKSRGSSNFSIFAEKQTKINKVKLQLTQEMDTALIQQQFTIFYQPQFDITTNQITGVEALLRWQHDSKGIISPVEFIAIAEENGIIKKLGLFVLEQACKQCMEWWDQGLPKFTLAINVSGKQLEPGFSSYIGNLLQELNFPIALLELEITETIIMESVHLAELNSLNDLGISIVLDNFGTGKTSLGQLKSLPIKKLKIDCSFIKNIPEEKNDAIMASTIIAMSHGLGITVVAVGVETDEQQTFLTAEKCNVLQGNLLSKPLSTQQVFSFLKQKN